MSSAAVGTHSGAGPLSLMSCVRESSPLQDFDSDTEKNVASKRRFWNPRKWFKRKNKVAEDVVNVETTEIGKDALRSRSTSELSVADEGRRRSSGSMHPGLSVSHDSVFHSPNSGSDLELDAAQSSSSLSISQPHADLRLQSELSERLRLRRGRGDTSEDDEGLPHSPCNSPTTSDGLLLDKTAIRDLPTKSHSSCSDGSLLSMDGSEMDEDSLGPHSRHSSKLSLYEKKSSSDSHFEFEPSSFTTPLNHSAAHHRVAVKPKRTHGAPRRKKGQQLSSALPATPEVNEDSSVRSISPENNRKESLTELYSMSTTRTTLTETQLKCSSLPPGLTAPGAETAKLNRSKSNAGSKSQDHFTPVHEEDKEEKVSLFDRIFPRRSGRKKKNKEEMVTKHEMKDELVTVTDSTVGGNQELRTSSSSMITKSYTNSTSGTSYTNISSMSSRHESSKPIAAPRSGPASRQRVLPEDIPATPDEVRRDPSIILPKPSPEKSLAGTSPLQAELESLFKQRQVSLSTSPPLKPSESPTPQSPKILTIVENPILPTVITSKTEHIHFAKQTSNVTSYSQTKLRGDDIRNKMKIPGLSSLQQRVLYLNDDDTDSSFKSLTEFSTENPKSKPIVKSHSFKSANKQSFTSEGDNTCTTEKFIKSEKEESRIAFTKAASLDSVKNLDERLHVSEARLELKKSKPDIRKSEETVNKISTEEERNNVMEELFRDSSITISGPSHTAVVNVKSSKDFSTSNSRPESTEGDISNTVSIKEHQVSVTKIQVKKESTQVSQSKITIPKSSVPEFLHKQLNRVDTRPSSNIIFSMKSPKITEEQKDRPKTLFDFDLPEVISKPPAPRKFSKENLEIIERDDKGQEETPPSTPPVVSVTPSAATPLSRFKKNDVKSTSRKSSVVSITPESPVREKPLFKTRSTSLDSLKSDVNESDKSSQDSLEKLDEDIKEKGSPTTDTTVVLRRKSVASKKKDEEPELMKVFARRSLKLKDSEVDAIQDSLVELKTRDSDKENQIDSPVDDRKKWFNKTVEAVNEEVPPKRKSLSREINEELPPKRKSLSKEMNEELPPKRKSLSKETKKEESLEIKSPIKEPLVESKVPETNNNKESSGGSPPVLRRTLNSNIFAGQRAVSLNPPKTATSELIIKKQSSFMEHRKVDKWIKTEEVQMKDTIIEDHIINNLTEKSEFITEPKNFSQRKAEWEKRAQQAQKKTTP